VQASYTVAGTVDTFDRASFTGRLASHLGVRSNEISLIVEAASVRVTATIASDEKLATDLKDALQTLAADTTAASAILGVAVEMAAAPLITQVMVAPPPPSPRHTLPPSATPDGSAPPPWGLIIGGALGALTIVVVGVVLVVLIRRRSATRMEPTRDAVPDAVHDAVLVGKAVMVEVSKV